MTGKKKDHWGSLASLLGMAPKAQPEPELEQPEPVVQAKEEPAESAAPPSPPPAPAQKPAPRAARPAPTKATPPMPAPKRRDHWGSVLGQLGVEGLPEPEPEPESAVAFEPQVEASSVAPQREAKPEIEDAASESPLGHPGPESREPRRFEREPRPPRAGEQRGRGDSRRPQREDHSRPAPSRPAPSRPAPSRSASSRRHVEDDVEFDEELDSGLRELWASHEMPASSAPRDEVADIDDADIDDAEIDDEMEDGCEAPSTQHGDKQRDDEQGRPRRRRRRRGRRGRRDSAAPAEGDEAARSRPPESPELDDLDLDELGGEEPGSEELERAPAPRREPERAARPSRSSREEEQRAPGKRRRRRRRPESAQADRAEPLDDLDDDDLDDPASVDYLSDSDKGEGHKRIPTWDDAVGAIVAANLESRNRNPQPPRREGRGRR
jgi:hypothetical protein